jgi:tRNA threonylcarbamoyladenosine biosynthesis protein TsaE
MPQSLSPKPVAPERICFDLADISATRLLAKEILALARPGDVIALAGPIGAGKTTFARFFIAAAGYEEEVPSPTFNLVQTYEGADADIWHFDLYRLERPEEAFELGIEQALDEAISLIEWPEKITGLLPREMLLINLRHGASDDERQVQIDLCGEWADRIDAEELSRSFSAHDHD